MGLAITLLLPNECVVSKDYLRDNLPLLLACMFMSKFKYVSLLLPNKCVVSMDYIRDNLPPLACMHGYV